MTDAEASRLILHARCKESTYWKRSPMPGKIEGRRSKQRMRWLDSTLATIPTLQSATLVQAVMMSRFIEKVKTLPHIFGKGKSRWLFTRYNLHSQMLSFMFTTMLIYKVICALAEIFETSSSANIVGH